MLKKSEFCSFPEQLMSTAFRNQKNQICKVLDRFVGELIDIGTREYLLQQAYDLIEPLIPR